MDSYYQQNKEKLIEYQKQYQNKIPTSKKRLYNNEYYHNVRKTKVCIKSVKIKNEKNIKPEPVKISNEKKYIIEF